MEREACHLREENEREDIVIEGNDWGENEIEDNEWEDERQAYYADEGQGQDEEVERDMNEDCNGDSDCLVTDYNDIDEDGCLTPSSTDEEDLFHEGRKKTMDVYNPRTDHVIPKFKVGQRFQDVAVTPQNPGVPLTNLQPAKYLWVSHISISHYRVSFTETHL